MGKPHIPFPKQGTTKEEILRIMHAAREKDIRWQDGRAFSLIYHAGEALDELLKTVTLLFFSENGLNPTAFPSLQRFEAEVVSMVADLLNGDENTVGNMTSGGTESILMAVKAARDWGQANRPNIQPPEIILPRSAHPAFEKAAHYFGLKVIHTPLRHDFRANPQAIRQAITPNTVLIVGSAPAYPHGVVDPIPELAKIAQQAGVLCHVDACVGGFMLPFVERLGYPVPPFDFRVPGVTSISADLHKYGYAAKGASVILYRHSHLRRYQLFACTDWPGGIYASGAMTGTRPAGPIAAAWAALKFLGEDGYLEITKKVMETVMNIRAGIANIPGITILGNPEMGVMALAGEGVDIYEVGDEMGLRGWHLDRQQFPPSLHLTINALHVGMEQAFLDDLAVAVARARRLTLHKIANKVLVYGTRWLTRLLPDRLVSTLTTKASGLLAGSGGGLPNRTAAMYGMMGTLPNRGDLKELVLDLVEGFTRVPANDD
ncbi:MAG: aspartate aminotransferase family protein [Chloroflexi bacterium]|nr:MAG: aspartate aminotransferase family protein [Chloroflexota bacterium]